MRTMVAAFAFVLPFSLVRQMLEDRWKEKKRGLAAAGGVLAGTAVSLAGNMHYVLFGKLIPWIREIFQIPFDGKEYWFPNSTRYIGYNPEVINDKTIHEFPSYSFILGDLHAHVVNLMFVLLVVGIPVSYTHLTEPVCSRCLRRCVRSKSGSGESGTDTGYERFRYVRCTERCNDGNYL